MASHYTFISDPISDTRKPVRLVCVSISQAHWLNKVDADLKYVWKKKKKGTVDKQLTNSYDEQTVLSNAQFIPVHTGNPHWTGHQSILSYSRCRGRLESPMQACI